MSHILNIETSTTNCSVSLSFENDLVDCIEQDSSNYSHSENLHVFIKELLNKNNTEFNQLSAISVSRGPGSYTGLRIGLSFTKGLAFAIKKPIIPIDTIESLEEEIDDSNYMIAINAYSNYFFIQKYKDNARFGNPFFDTFEKINYNNNIYGYGLKESSSCFNIAPSSIKIANIAYKKYDQYKCDNIKLIKPNYIKPLQFNIK